MVVVDDDPSIRRALARLIVSCGLRVETYASSEDFLATSHPGGIACLIVDVQMGEMSGLELLDRLAAAGDMPPAIIITAHDDSATRRRADRSEAVFLRKPFESAALLAAVGRAVGRELEHLPA